MKRLLFLFLLLLITLPNAAFGWQRHSFGSIEKPIYLMVDDLDEDGDLDVAAGSGSSGEPINSEVAWFENDIDNSGSFIKGIISPATPTSEAIQNAEGINFADVDKDGQKDVVVATGRMGNQYGGSYWFKSPLNFQGQWTRYPIYDPTSGNSFYKVYAIDANEDTWPDFVIGGDSGAYIYFNPTNPTDPLATWDQLLLDPYSGPSVNLADVDNDGKVDILNTNTGIAPPETVGNVSWIKIINDGGDVSVVRTVIDSALKMAFDISAMDITGDSYPEVFVSIFNPPGQKNKGIYWYENPGPENGLWIKNVLDPVFEASDIYIGDIDGDGQDDLVASALFKNKISWFGYEWVAGTAVWTEHVVDPEVNRPGDISLNDFDGDGDMDIVVTVLNDHEMVWYENKGLFNSIPCFAESIYGEHSKEAELLRDFRDNVLSKTHEGRETIRLYYEWSPSIVEVMEKNAELRENLKIVIDEKLPLIKEKLE